MTQPTDTPETTTPETPSDEPDFTPITSKKDLDRLIGAARKADRQRIAELQTKAAKYDEAERAKMTQAEQDAERITRLQTELDAERTARTRDGLLRTVLRDEGLPEEASDFIIGNDEEEMRASAAKLKTLGGQPKPKADPKKLKSSFGGDSRMDPMEKAAAAMREFRRGG